METELHIIYLTKKCNLACKYCYERDKENIKMTRETVKDIIDELMAAYEPSIAVKIMLFGGEPFLNWDVLLYAIDYVYQEYYIKKQRKVILLTTSNGTLVKKDRVRQLFKYRDILNIEISIDGDKETQDAHRIFPNGAGSHDIVMRNVQTLLQYFPHTTARMVITDIDKYYDNVVYLHEQGFKKFLIQAVRYGDNGVYPENYSERFCIITEKVLDYLKQDPFTIINGIQYPFTKNSSSNNDYYNYFLPDGGRIKQKTYVEAEFQHFSKGTESSYNLLKGEK